MLTLSSAGFDNGNVTVTWSDPQPVAGTQEYITTVYCTTVPYFGNNSPSTAAGQPMTVAFNPDQPDPLVDSNSYYLEVAAYDGNGNVLARSQHVALLAFAPSQLAARYQNEALGAQWNALTTAGVTGYRVQLLQGGQVLETQTPSGPSVIFRTAPQPSKVYQIQVQAQGSSTSGPWRQIDYAPLLLAAASFGNGQATVTWSDPQPIAGTAQYIATVYCTTLPDFGNNSPPIPAAGPFTVSFDPGQSAPLQANLDYTLIVASYDDNGDLLAKSDSLVLLAFPPTQTALSYTGTQLRAAWTNCPNSGIVQYAVQLLQNGSAVENETAAAGPLLLTADFQTGKVYQLQVQAAGNRTTGPWSPLASGPMKSALVFTFDGLGRLSNYAANAQTQIAYTYDNGGNLLTETVTIGP